MKDEHGQLGQLAKEETLTKKTALHSGNFSTTQKVIFGLALIAAAICLFYNPDSQSSGNLLVCGSIILSLITLRIISTWNQSN